MKNISAGLYRELPMMTAWFKTVNEQLARLRMLPMVMLWPVAANDLPISTRQSTSPTPREPTISDALSTAYCHRGPSFALSLSCGKTCRQRRKLCVADWIRFLKWWLVLALVAMVVEEGPFQNPTLNSISLHCLLGTSSWRLSICSFARWSTAYAKAERQWVPQSQTSESIRPGDSCILMCTVGSHIGFVRRVSQSFHLQTALKHRWRGRVLIAFFASV